MRSVPGMYLVHMCFRRDALAFTSTNLSPAGFNLPRDPKRASPVPGGVGWIGGIGGIRGDGRGSAFCGSITALVLHPTQPTGIPEPRQRTLRILPTCPIHPKQTLPKKATPAPPAPGPCADVHPTSPGWIGGIGGIRGDGRGSASCGSITALVLHPTQPTGIPEPRQRTLRILPTCPIHPKQTLPKKATPAPPAPGP